MVIRYYEDNRCSARDMATTENRPIHGRLVAFSLAPEDRFLGLTLTGLDLGEAKATVYEIVESPLEKTSDHRGVNILAWSCGCGYIVRERMNGGVEAERLSRAPSSGGARWMSEEPSKSITEERIQDTYSPRPWAGPS